MVLTVLSFVIKCPLQHTYLFDMILPHSGISSNGMYWALGKSLGVVAVQRRMLEDVDTSSAAVVLGGDVLRRGVWRGIVHSEGKKRGSLK